MMQPPAVPSLTAYAPYEDGREEPDAKESARQLCNSHLDQLFDNLPDAIALIDRDHRLVRVNPEFCRLFGYAPEEVIGRPLTEMIVPDFLHPEASGLMRRLLRGERVAVETVRRRADGSLVDVSVLGFAIVEQGEPVAVYGVYRDITAVKRGEAERHELLARERRDHSGPSPADRREEILAAATGLLNGGGTAEEVLSALARFLVPVLADSCIVYLQDAAGRVRRVEVAFADAQQEDLLREQLNHYPPDLPRLIPPVARALNTGEAQLLPEVSIGALKAVPGDTEHVSVALLVGLTSLLVVPLSIEGRTVGAISFGTADSGRRYHADDLVLAEEIARRAAAVVAPRIG